MLIRRWRSAIGLAVAIAAAGCRPSEPPRYTPGVTVVELTEGLDPTDEDDREELEIYQDLQQQSAKVLERRAGRPDAPLLIGNPHVDPEHLKRGYRLYAQFCTMCHGVNGDGQGPVAPYLNPKPRNYTAGVYKFVATDNGSKARKADLVRTVRRGVTGTSMPSFDRFSEEDLSAVVDYVMALTYRGLLEEELARIAYDEEELPDDEGIDEVVEELLEPWRAAAEEVVMPLTPMPPMNEESIAEGKRHFVTYGCNKCHGEDGRGGSIGDVEIGKDVWGYDAAAADLTSGMFRGGDRPLDVYRRVYVGINGAPMPSRAVEF
ncbi:MAG: c-type cytochrome, partial [Planctomycetota bacterium]